MAAVTAPNFSWLIVYESPFGLQRLIVFVLNLHIIVAVGRNQKICASVGLNFRHA